MERIIEVEDPIRLVENLSGWFRLERVLPEGRPTDPWVEVDAGISYWTDPARLDPRTSVEGSLDEWRQVAGAVLAGRDIEFRRCAAEVRGSTVLFHSPRNSNDCLASVPTAVARAAMTEFLAAHPLPGQDAP
jgi:hypothetical protein